MAAARATYRAAPPRVPSCAPSYAPSWRRRPEDRDCDPAAAADIDAVDPRAAGIAYAERLGAQREGALLSRLDEGEAATARFQELGGAGAVRVLEIRADEKHEARLVIAGGRDLWVG